MRLSALLCIESQAATAGRNSVRNPEGCVGMGRPCSGRLHDHARGQRGRKQGWTHYWIDVAAGTARLFMASSRRTRPGPVAVVDGGGGAAKEGGWTQCSGDDRAHFLPFFFSVFLDAADSAAFCSLTFCCSTRFTILRSSTRKARTMLRRPRRQRSRTWPRRGGATAAGAAGQRTGRARRTRSGSRRRRGARCARAC